MREKMKGELKELNTLGDSVICLHLNGATSIDSIKVTGVKPNHICLTDNWHEENIVLECGGGKHV